MKKVFEIIKDILYDSIDYIIMIGIVAIVVLVIGWRLDLLFANDALDIPQKDNIVVEDNTSKDSGDVVDNQEEQNVDNPDDEESNDNDVVENTEEDPKDSVDGDKVVKITIPAGSLPSKIGSILESNGLVTSKAEFVQKAQDLKLDTKLKSGNYEIKTGTSIEEIIKLIAK